MKLHANAALSVEGRRELCRRVGSAERPLGEAAPAPQMVGRYRRAAELGLLDRSSAQARSAWRWLAPPIPGAFAQ